MHRRPPRGSRPPPSTSTAGGRRGRAGTPTPLWRDSLGSLYHAEGREVDPDVIVQESDDDDGDGLFGMGEWISGGPNQRWTSLLFLLLPFPAPKTRPFLLCRRLFERWRTSAGSSTTRQFSRRVNLRLMEHEDMPSSLQHYFANATTMNWRDRVGGSSTSMGCLANEHDSPGSRNSRQGHYKMQLLPCIKKHVSIRLTAKR